MASFQPRYDPNLRKNLRKIFHKLKITGGNWGKVKRVKKPENLCKHKTPAK